MGGCGSQKERKTTGSNGKPSKQYTTGDPGRLGPRSVPGVGCGRRSTYGSLRTHNTNARMRMHRHGRANASGVSDAENKRSARFLKPKQASSETKFTNDDLDCTCEPA